MSEARKVLETLNRMRMREQEVKHLDPAKDGGLDDLFPDKPKATEFDTSFNVVTEGEGSSDASMFDFDYIAGRKPQKDIPGYATPPKVGRIPDEKKKELQERVRSRVNKDRVSKSRVRENFVTDEDEDELIAGLETIGLPSRRKPEEEEGDRPMPRIVGEGRTSRSRAERGRMRRTDEDVISVSIGPEGTVISAETEFDTSGAGSVSDADFSDDIKFGDGSDDLSFEPPEFGEEKPPKEEKPKKGEEEEI